MAGIGPTGVLAKGQLEFTLTNLSSQSNTFYTGSKQSDPYFDKLNGNYSLLRTEYGLNERLTLSASIGHYPFKTIYEFAEEEGAEQHTISSGGFGDLIFLPRYRVFNKQANGHTSELNLGLGFKLPLSQANDSNYVGTSKFLNTSQGTPFIDSFEIWQLSPPLVQTTTGSVDMMASIFYLHTLGRDFTFFASGFYIHRGWNSIGVKFGDFSSLGLFISKSLGWGFSASMQVRGEWVGQMKTIKGIDFLSEYNIDQSSTGSFCVNLSPMLNYSYKSLRFFTMADMPVYQNLNGNQLGLPRQLTLGVSYFLFPDKDDKVCETPIEFTQLTDTLGGGLRDTTFKVFGNCSMCKATIESTVSKMKGISSAVYSVETNMLTLHFDEEVVTVEKVKKKLAKVGYDTETHKASKAAYNSLHGCCKYEREGI